MDQRIPITACNEWTLKKKKRNRNNPHNKEGTERTDNISQRQNWTAGLENYRAKRDWSLESKEAREPQMNKEAFGFEVKRSCLKQFHRLHHPP